MVCDSAIIVMGKPLARGTEQGSKTRCDKKDLRKGLWMVVVCCGEFFCLNYFLPGDSV